MMKQSKIKVLMSEYVVLLMLVLCYSVAANSTVVPGSGVFGINGIFQITNEENEINYQTGVMMSEALKYAVKAINEGNHLYGYKIGIASPVEDYPTEAEVRLGVLNTFLQQIPFLVGPYTSELSYIASILTGTFRLASVSYSASYSDFSRFGPKQFMMRTIPSDLFRVRAAIDVIEELNWNYFAIVSSYGYNGEREAVHFASKIVKRDICISNQIDLPKKSRPDDFLAAVDKISEDRNVRAIVLFTVNRDSRMFLKAIQRRNLARRFYIMCLYGCSNYKEVVQGIEETAAGVISLDVHSEEIPGFKKYFLNLKPDLTRPKAPFSRFWESVFNCTLQNVKGKSNCTGREQLAEGRGYYPLTPVHTVINAVSSIARALQVTVVVICDSARDWMQGASSCVIDPKDSTTYVQQIVHVMQALDFEFDVGTLKQYDLLLKKEDYKVRYDIHSYLSMNGSYQNMHIGTWEMNRTDALDNYKSRLRLHHAWHLKNGTHGKPNAICSAGCPKGHVKERDTNPNKAKCCWECKACPFNHIVVNDTCIQCQLTEMANIDTNECEPLPISNIQLSRGSGGQGKNVNAGAVFFTMACIIGLSFVTVVVAFFVKYNHYRMVRASGRDLCYMILFGICLLFLCPFLFLAKPSLTVCLLRSGLPGVGFLTCYAPLFLKTNRIYRIFCHAKKSVSRPSLVSSRSLLLVSFGIVIVQVLLIGVWFVSKVPSPEAVVSKDGRYITIHCRGDSSPILLLLNVALSVLFMISCTVLAFKTRHFPKNYNEAKYIGITLYITCVAWAIFLPAYFLMPEKDFMREFFMCGLCTIIGYITLFGLFGHKIRLLMCQHELEQGNANLPTWYLSYSDCKENGDAMMARAEQNGNSDETIA